MPRNRSHHREMEALGALAVAQRHIRALSTARLRLRRALSRPVAPRTARIGVAEATPAFGPRARLTGHVAPRSASGAPGSRRARLALPVRRKSKLFRALSHFARQDARRLCLWGRLPTIHRRNSLCTWIFPGGLKGRGSLAFTVVACATPIRAKRGYVVQRPRAARGLSSLYVDCGAVSGRRFFHAEPICNSC